jgi:hypothetical protein
MGAGCEAVLDTSGSPMPPRWQEGILKRALNDPGYVVFIDLCACLCVEGPFWLKISLSRPSYFPVRPASSGSRATIGFVEPQDLRVQTTGALLFFAADEPGSAREKNDEASGLEARIAPRGQIVSLPTPLKRAQKGGRSKGDSAAAHYTHGASKHQRAVPCRDGRLPARRGHSNALRTQRQEATRDAICVAPRNGRTRPARESGHSSSAA